MIINTIILFDNFFCLLFANSRKEYDKERNNDNDGE